MIKDNRVEVSAGRVKDGRGVFVYVCLAQAEDEPSGDDRRLTLSCEKRTQLPPLLSLPQWRWVKLPGD